MLKNQFFILVKMLEKIIEICPNDLWNSKKSGFISPNVKVVYDVFGVAIKELRSGSSNPKNVAERKPHKGRSPTAVFRSPSPEGAKRIQSC
jgi:hypothetical protein